ncbi:hypothetical protein COP1_028449 [Malus domestica]
MARAPSSILSFLRHNHRARQNPNTQIRYLTTETKDSDFTEISQQICQIIRTKPRWEQTLPSDYPSFNFTDPQFFTELLKHQRNVFFSLRFFFWLSSQNGFSPNPVSCNALFTALVEAKACNAAKLLLGHTGFSPDPASLESYIGCLCEGGYVQEAADVFYRLKGAGVCLSIMTWNAALSGCLKVGRTDIIWILYQEMIECGVVADVETVGYLIQALCVDNNVLKGYELLRQVLVDGLVPGNAAFNKLISGFCKVKNYNRVSELLHIMISKNRDPDNYTYQEVINWLCKKGKGREGLRVFNDLKHRGYAPDIVMYTTMIHGLCTMDYIGEARKLWFEMIEKGYRPNEYTYNTMILGFCKIGSFEEAKILYKEMCDRGYKETTVSYNAMMRGLCLHGRTDEAYGLFTEMPHKGIVRDLITYNTLIQGFCKEGKIVESTNLFRELLTQGLQPSTYSYTPLIEKLCQVGAVQEAKSLWNDMKNRGLEPTFGTQDYIIIGLCDQGDAAEGMEWFLDMLKSYTLEEHICYSLQIRDELGKGYDIVLRVDIQGAQTLRKILGNLAVFIFLMAESEAKEEVKHVKNFDYVVVNAEGRLDNAVKLVESTIDVEEAKVQQKSYVI